MTRDTIAVIGAGAAGAGVVFGLRDADERVVLLEGTTRIGGRLVTRTTDEYCVDTAANYITPSAGAMASVLHDLDTTGLIDITEPVWTHTEDGQITLGDPDRQDAHKWTYTTGINTFAHRVLSTTNQPVRLGHSVASLHETPAGWDINREDGSRILTATSVVCTPPAPETARILDESTSTTIDTTALSDVIGAGSYRSIITCVLGYSQGLDREFYASVNTDGNHPIGWVSREACKRGHVPPGECVLVVQMAPSWSSQQIASSDEDILQEATREVAGVFGEDWVGSPDWAWCDRFPTALPNTHVPTDAFESAGDAGLFFAGDWRVGRGRVSEAFHSGVRIASHLPT